MAEGINYTGDLPCYVLDHLFDHLTDKSYCNVDDRNNVDLLRIITRGYKDRVCDIVYLCLIVFVDYSTFRILLCSYSKN